MHKAEDPRELVLVQSFALPSPMANTRQILSTACAIAAQGVRTHIFCRKLDPRPSDVLLREEFGLERPAELVLHRLSASKPLAGFGYRRRLVRLLLGSTERTIFYGRHRRQMLQLLRLARLLRSRGRFLFEFHNLEHVLEREKQNGSGSRDEAGRVRAEEALVVERCHAVAAISQPLAQDLAAEFALAEPPEVIPDGVDLALFGNLGRPFSVPGRIRLGYAGSLYSYKGVRHALDALRELGPEVSLRVIGGNPRDELERLRQASRDLGPRVEFTGTVKASEVPRHLAECDLVVLPAGEERRTARYASPLKMFEAMGTGLPIVAAPTSAYRSILVDGKTAFLGADGSGRGLAAAVRRACGDPPGAMAIGACAARAAQGYSWDERALRILDLAARTTGTETPGGVASARGRTVLTR